MTAKMSAVPRGVTFMLPTVEHEQAEVLKMVVALCTAVHKSNAPTAEGLVAGWDLLQDRPELAKAAGSKFADEIDSSVSRMTKGVGRTHVWVPYYG